MASGSKRVGHKLGAGLRAPSLLNGPLKVGTWRSLTTHSCFPCDSRFVSYTSRTSLEGHTPWICTAVDRGPVVPQRPIVLGHRVGTCLEGFALHFGVSGVE